MDFLESKLNDDSSNKTMKVVELEISKINIIPMSRTHYDEDEISDLAISIEENGLLQPILVQPEDNDEYTLILGAKRLLAYSRLGKTTIQAIIHEEKKSPLQLLSLQLTENILRESPSIVDLSDSVRKLSEEYHLTPDEISKKISIKKAYVYTLLKISKLSDLEKDTLKEMNLQFLEQYCSFKKEHEDDDEPEKFVRSCLKALGDLEKSSPEKNTKANRVGIITAIFENTNSQLKILEKE